MMSGTQLAEWEEFDRLEPIGGHKQDFRFAQLCDLVYVLAAAANGKKAESRVQDFMPWWYTQYLKGRGKSKGKQSVESMKANLMAWAKQHNKTLERKAKQSGRAIREK